MLDKISEKTIKITISKYNGDLETDIPIFASDVGIDYTELNALCNSLKQQNFFSLCLRSNHSTNPVLVRLSHQGLHYFENKRKKRIDFVEQLALSKISDVVVAFITALITYFVMPFILNLLG